MDAQLTLISTIAGIVFSASVFVWKKVLKPTMQFVEEHDGVVDSINTIKKEITTNGGGSLKDAVCNLNDTCYRIENRQRIIEQRTHACLHYSSTALFETDSSGRLVWTNDPFYKLTVQSLSDLQGFDWLSYIHEDEREEFLGEFNSCLKMNRKFIKETQTSDAKDIRVSGFPYRLGEEEQGGFLVSVCEI